MSKRFNLEDYVTVKERKQLFFSDYPMGVIAPELVSDPNKADEFVVFRTSVWKERSASQCNLPPDATGYSFSKAGGQQADRYAWTENCEESAIGRALDNLGYAVDKKCSREEMEKVEYMKSIQNNVTPVNQGKANNQTPSQRTQGNTNNRTSSQQTQGSQPQRNAPKPQQQAPQQETPQQEVAMIADGQIDGIKKSLAYHGQQSGETISVENFLKNNMKLDKKLEQLTFKEAVSCMKELNKLVTSPKS